MMEPAVAMVLFILAIIGIETGSLLVVGVSILLIFLMAREFTPYFVLGVGIMYGLTFMGLDKMAWGAISLAVAALLIVAAGKPWKKQEEEIPPEMIPYLLAMMGGRR